MITRSATKVPMKRLLAVASLVGAVSGTAIAITPADAPAPAPTPVVVDVVAVAPVSPAAPVEPVIVVEPIRPIELGNGWPACANVGSKAGPPRHCRIPQQTLEAVLQSPFATGSSSSR